MDGAPLPELKPAEKPAGKTIMQAWEAFKAEKILTKAWKDGGHTAKYHHWPHIRDLIEVVGDKPYVTGLEKANQPVVLPNFEDQTPEMFSKPMHRCVIPHTHVFEQSPSCRSVQGPNRFSFRSP